MSLSRCMSLRLAISRRARRWRDRASHWAMVGRASPMNFQTAAFERRSVLRVISRTEDWRALRVAIAKAPDRVTGRVAARPNEAASIERSDPAGKAPFLGVARALFMEARLRRSLPPLNALRSFEAAARHQSFTRAADELCVTQGAVSHQVKALEAELGLKLFNRGLRGLAITEPGRNYLAAVQDAFDRIALGTDRLLQRQQAGIVTVSTSPDFAAKWLVSRLGRFSEAHPEIELKISATMHHADFAREDVDLAIRHGAGDWVGLDAVNLCSEELFPVCSPGFLRDRRCLRVPEDVLQFPLLHLDDRRTWSRWLEAAGASGEGLLHGPILNHASMLIDAAINGQGITLARTALVAADLINGRLIRPFQIALSLKNTYWIVCPRATSMLPKIVAFRDWLLAEATGDAQRLEAHRATSVCA